jgi:UDP-GlcNAc:undecaprenyl-phosphate GlcNAc-1-phosphate transferase
MAFVLTWFIIPSVVNISRLKNLYATPNGRTSHISSTPNLGGIAVFVALILSTVIFAGTYFKFELKYIISGLIIVFFVGIKDDILIIAPMKKLTGQIFAVIIIAVFAQIRITNLYGLFHIGQLPYVASILLTVFVFIVIINGFNLIDGIDGLASGIGILTSAVFGIWFWMTGNIGYAIFSFSFVGTLAAFFRFNVFGKTNKIFLGDTGSLLTGFVVGVLACRFLQLGLVAQGTTFIESAPTVVFGILIIPLFDSLRVFILRVKQGKSPFKADRQHIHHRLLQLRCTHLQATAILISVNLFFIVLSYALRGIGIIWLMGLILGSASLMSYILVTYAKRKRKEEINCVLSMYFALKTSKDRKIVIGNVEKPQRRIYAWNRFEKAGATVN